MLLEDKTAVIYGGGAIGDAAAFAASDRARTMTAATINVSCGALLD